MGDRAGTFQPDEAAGQTTPSMGSRSIPQTSAANGLTQQTSDVQSASASITLGANEPDNEHRGSDDDDEVGSDSDDSDRYRLICTPEVARGVSALRQRGVAAFHEWIEKSQRLAVKLPNGQAGGINRVPMARLFQSDEEKRIIASPREYQIELFERAKERNIIIVLDTGSGKTLIAALLLRHTLEQELERRAHCQPKKVAFFLVDKVALCFQQYSVLKANLEHPVAKLYGEMAGIMRTKEFWDKQFADNMVLVCTAQIVLDCLNSGFLHISQVNLLIFDEAHHTKKNHPYARIIKDHYLREPNPNNRPRILGMTASPVDAQTRDLRAAAIELESILCSEIATVSDEALIQSQAQRCQMETKEYYDRLIKPEDARTPLWKEMAGLISDDIQYRVHFDATQEAASILGAWCADRYWELFLTDTELSKRVVREQSSSSGIFTVNGLSEADRVLSTLHQAQKIIRDHAASKTAVLDGASMAFSSKVKALHHILEDAFRQDARRCIVFVQKRYAAILLADLFQHVDTNIPNLRSACLVGSQTMSSSIANMSIRDQVLSLQRFRRGETNCLFATQVAEEGIDIPECDLIVRFDLYDSAIQYIQSKGRARQAKSTYISMLEEGNMQHLRRLKQATRDANALRQFCSALPADRKIQDTFDPTTSLEHERIAQKVYEIRETGARLTFASSQEVLSRFVSSLSYNDMLLTPEYVITSSYTSKKFVATIVFPESSPIKSMNGFAQRNKQLARCSAAFEACVDLIKKKYINGHLQPTFSKRLPAMRNARLALSSKKQGEYIMRVKPEVWSQLGPDAPTELFQAVLALDDPEAVGRPTSPLVLLSRFPLPSLEPTLLYLYQGRTSVARLMHSSNPLQVTTDEVEALTNFTLIIFADVFSKDYSAGPEQMPYFMAPSAVVDTKSLNGDSPLVDWKQLDRALHSKPPTWRGAQDGELFHHKFVLDPWDGSRKFIIHGINKSLKPSDPVPEGAPVPKSRGYRFVEQSIKEYSNSLTLKSRQRQTWDEGQPVFNAELLPLRRNFLDKFNAEEAQSRNKNMRCWLILEPLWISRLPIEVASMAMIVPVIMHRIDSLLITLEACTLLDLDIRPYLALEALTKDSSNTEEHGEEQVDFQVGMGNNYERLECLGDAFLKMATTVSLFTLMPNTNEFEYHVERMLLVCNQNLFNHAVDRKLQEYVRSKSFDRRMWYPNLQLRKGKARKAEVWHRLSDKSIADVCEALIGAAYIGGIGTGVGEMDLAVKAVSKMVKSKKHKMLKFSEYYEAFKMPDWQTAPASAAQRAAVDRIHKVTGYRFEWPLLLRSAFKHPSYPYETIPSYQRLEFLGDALLDLVIVDYLFKRFPNADPQWLTEHKMAMVSNHFFGFLCVQLGLQRHLLMATSMLIGQIGDFVAELELAKETAKLEVEANGLAARQDFWLATSQPPKVLSDMLEALVGAMFVDSRYDYAVVRRFFAAFIQPYFEDMALYDTYVSRHPVTALTHILQNKFNCQRWRLYVSMVPVAVDQGAAALTDDDVVCALMVHEQAVEHTTGRTGRDAKQVVAKMALQRFEGMDRNMFRAGMGCDCIYREGGESLSLPLRISTLDGN